MPILVQFLLTVRVLLIENLIKVSQLSTRMEVMFHYAVLCPYPFALALFGALP